MSVGQKLAKLKIRSTHVIFLSLRDLEAAPEEAMQFKRPIKSSNESLTLFHAGFLRVLSHAGGGSCEPPPGISAVAP